ncbi:putative penicillin-binding protein [Actinoplanes missouriensis 431]|uniref:Putative penicillin-binding protein n=1 Tax=Actinoplanes missouriensis (strain ATCC 14538 / DSM 43046 / CBS 188.64 / JCM 3121 / NBRC 102363 / NCIMB 12654 / NRRL B-3342 / UNCC 431) TaxID=512565 RepID=I0H151_ACTM4|nr:putative penicillin-binding protein [Actinoplanes missouriensis 431]
MAERGRLPRSGRTTDPFRPALQVLDGGDTAPRARGRNQGAREADEDGTDARRSQREPAAPRTKSAPRTKKEPEAAPRRRQPTRPEKRPERKPEKARRPEKRVPAEPPKLANSTRRLRLGTVLALSLFVMIGVRLVVLQVATSPDEAASLLELRERRLSTVELPAPRGSILDRSGAVLAHSVEARYVYVDPENANLQKDVPGTAAKLAPLLRIQQSKLIELMQRKQSLGRWLKFRYLARGVDVAVADKIEAMRLPGIYTHTDERRDVPGKDLAANLIGFTGDDHHGLEGLEARYDELLHGTDGKRVFEVGKGSLGAPIPGGYERYTAAQPGNSLQLTIDRYVQYEVQRILDAQAEKNKATVAGAVVLDARTGEVLAQASYPAYNAAKPEAYDAQERIDVPTSVVTDPGSSHKAFIFGAALQEGLIKPDSTLTIGPALERGGEAFKDTHPQPKGTEMTMPGLLAYSSNVGTILIGEKLGKEKIYEYQQKFGLGQATGEGMPGEAEGMLLKPEDWSGSAPGSVPIGHSVSATLIQMAAAYGAIANDGTYIQPHLIKSTISGADGKVTPAAEPKTHKVLEPAVASQLRTMMEAVVDAKGGTGGAAAVTGYRVAGKTGTGKMLIDGQYTSHNASSFIGMAPAEDPRYVIAVSMDVATGGGGDVAAPAFSEMMSYTLLHYFVPPSGTKPPTFKIHP